MKKPTKQPIARLKASKQTVNAAMGGSIKDLTVTQMKELALVLAPALLLLVAAFFTAYQFVAPAPPQTVVMTTGSETGGYHAFGKKYAAILKRSGIELQLKTSAGSLENLARLKDPASDVSVGLLQGGVSNSANAPDIRSIGRMFLEPLWIFYRGSEPLNRIAALQGRRIAVGPEGSGTRHLSMTLLGANQITATTATLLPITGQAAVDALKTGQADAVFLTLAPEAPLLQALMRDQNVRLMSLSDAEAYTRLFPFLSRITLPRGTFDLVRQIPEVDSHLVAPVAALAVKSTLHPAIAGLLAEAAREVHAPGGLFHRVGDYPKPLDPEFDMSDDADRYYKNGPSFLKRFLPFWLATFIERMTVLIVPLATLIIPLVKVLPWLFRWRVRTRFLYWYGRLKTLESRLIADVAGIEYHEQLAEFMRIDEAVATIPVPLSSSEQYYALRSAIDLVRQRLAAKAGHAAPVT